MSSTGRKSIGKVFEESGTFAAQPGLCPHCGAYAQFQDAGALNSRRGAPGVPQYRGVVVFQVNVGNCCLCNCAVIGLRDGNNTQDTRRYLWPVHAWPDNAPPNLEPEIKKAYDESRATLPLSPMASAVLARRCLQHLIREKLGIKKSNLFDEIDESLKRDELSKTTRECLHHVRQLGNWGAHPSIDQANTVIDVEPEDAEYTLDALEMVFEDLYVRTQRAEAMQARIRNKKAPVVVEG